MSQLFFKSAAYLGAVLDLLIYSLAIWWGINPFSAHIISFICAAPLYYYFYLPLRQLLRYEDKYLFSRLSILVVCICMLIALRGGLLSFVLHSFASHKIIAFLPVFLLTLVVHELYRYLLKRYDAGISSIEFLSLIALVVIAYTFFVRLFYLDSLELLPEEAYYWNYARHFSAGYIDHPPMVGWLIAAGVRSFGLNEFGVRFFGFCSAVCAAIFISLLTLRVFDKTSALIAFVLGMGLPYFFGAGIFMSPDAPLILFWAAGIFFLTKALLGDGKINWILFSAAIGFGMLSKYTIVLLAVAALVVMIVNPRFRKWLKDPIIYIGAFIALLIFSPVIYWNITHHFASFAFQSTRRLESAVSFSLPNLLLDMMYLVTPVGVAMIFPVFFTKVFRENREDRSRDGEFVCKVCFLIPVSVFLLYSLRHVPKLNWTGPSFIALLPFFAFVISSAAQKGFSGSRFVLYTVKSWIPVLCIWFAAAGLVLHYLGLGLPLIPYSEKMHRMIGWRSMVDEVLVQSQRIELSTGQRPVLVGMDKHTIAAELSFYVTKKEGYDTYRFGSRNIVGDEALMFSIWSPAEQFENATMMLIAKNEDDLTDDKLKPHFEQLSSITAMPLKTGWSHSKTFFYRVGHGYHQGENKQQVVPAAIAEEPTPVPLPTVLEDKQPTPVVIEQAPPEINRS